MAGQRFFGSICITDIMEHFKKGHSGFVKGENGKFYANCSLFLNDEEDKFGNVISVKLSCKKEKAETEGKNYIGNFKESEDKGINKRDAKAFGDDLETMFGGGSEGESENTEGDNRETTIPGTLAETNGLADPNKVTDDLPF